MTIERSQGGSSRGVSCAAAAVHPRAALQDSRLHPVAEHRWEALVHELDSLVSDDTALHAELFQHRAIQLPASVSTHQLAQQGVHLHIHNIMSEKSS